jgi:DNA polymerase-1
MAKLELFKMIEKMGLNSSVPAPSPEQASFGEITIENCEDNHTLLADLKKAGRADFISVYQKGKIEKLIFNINNTVCIVKADKDFLCAFCEEESIQKNTHDSKPFYAALDKIGIVLNGMKMDTLLAGYLLNPSASGYDVARMAAEYEVPVPAVKEEEIPQVLAAAILPGLADKLTLLIKQNTQGKLLSTIEMPLAKVLARMETVGFAVNAQGIADYGNELQLQIDEMQAKIHAEVGYGFNINSPKQLGEALFEKLGLHHGKKTKSGYSTSADVLESLRYEHPVVEMVLNYRTLAKLKSTYCDGLIKVIADDGRIHSNFNQTETRTGRISSTEPNLQNIPVRTDLGRELRRFFVAREGWLLVDADYSQIELRVLAHVANDPNMIAAFQNNDDIHRATAAQVFHMPEEMVTPIMRSRAKAVNFGIVYGIGAFSLAKDINVSRKEAETYIHDYLEHYSGIREYMEKVVAQAKEQGYVETMFGRRRYLPELASSNFNLRAFGERVARNMPIQGAAADIIKIAMIKVEERLEKENMQARLILQVHDELIVEAPKEEAERAAQILTEEMQNAVSLLVPMLAEANMGQTWYDAKG